MQVNILEAKNQLSKLVQAVLDGEEVVIAKNGTPVVRLVKLADQPKTTGFGAWKGLMELPDDWDSPETNAAIAKSFLDSPLFPAKRTTPTSRKRVKAASTKKKPTRAR